MANPKEKLVRVVARHTTDLHQLADTQSLLEIPCGSIGRLIALAVLEGNGTASVPVSDIRMAIDTQDGVHAILDHFDLEDPDTRRPLLFERLR